MNYYRVQHPNRLSVWEGLLYAQSVWME